MNTLKKNNLKVSDFQNGRIIIEDYRFYQQSMVEYFLEVMINYISSMNPTHIQFDRIEKTDIVTYHGLSNNELVKYVVFVKIANVSKEFFQIYIPRLIYDNFYYLNGNYYVPLLYIIDKPIIIKENSVSLASLFSSITMNFKSKMCIFTGRNLDLELFVSAFLFDDTSDETIEIGNHLNISTDVKLILSHFKKILDEPFKDIQEIRNYAEKLFFDGYTRDLYSSCYFNNDNIKVSSLKDIIKISLIMFYSGKIFDFIDLKNKRISFIELLLTPLFKKVANVTIQVSKGFSIDVMSVDQYVVVKNFHKNDSNKAKNNKTNFKSFHGLSGKTLYDLVNLYSSLLVHKCSFVKPGMKSPPKSIANIHDSHFGKICPITVSSINPGEMLSIVPEIFVDPFGQFLDLD